MARGCPYSAASLATSTERLFVLLRKGSALLTEETAFQAIQGDLGDHLIIHASCNYMQMQLVFFLQWRIKWKYRAVCSSISPHYSFLFFIHRKITFLNSEIIAEAKHLF